MAAGAAPALLAAEPQLFTPDLPAALAFYAERLGFEPAFVHGDPPFYAQVRRGAARLNLRHVDAPRLDPAARFGEPDLLAATLVVNGIEALFAELERRGAPLHQPLRTEPWGARTFIVRDLDGALLLFAGEGAAP